MIDCAVAFFLGAASGALLVLHEHRLLLHVRPLDDLDDLVPDPYAVDDATDDKDTPAQKRAFQRVVAMIPAAAETGSFACSI